MPSPAYATNEDEYWYNVSPQELLPIAGEIELDIDLNVVAELFSSLSTLTREEDAHNLLFNELIKYPTLFSYIRQFLGISDKRAYLDLSYIASRTKHPSKSCSLTGCHPWTLSRHPMAFFLRLLDGSQGRDVQIVCAEMISEYLLKQGLYITAKGFSNVNTEIMELIYTRLIVPKEYQQKAAKRRGHGCEAALASVIQKCGVDIIPEDKATNPMGSNDPHINITTMSFSQRVPNVTHAFDLIIKNTDNSPRILIQSLIHTSDPGQFGVDKSNETVSIANEIRKWNESNHSNIELWALLDGVGYSENKPDTINKMLGKVDYFIQLKTLYKAPLRLHKLGFIRIKAIRFTDYYDKEDIVSIKDKYIENNIQILSADEPFSSERIVRAGEAILYI